MKKIIEKIIQFRNPNFKFDASLTDFALFQFIWMQCWSLIRGFRLLLFLKNPKGALIGRNVRFFNLPKITFGKFLKLVSNVYISALSKSGVTFGNNVGIGDFSRVIVSTSLNDIGNFIKIGNNVGIGEFAYLGGAGGFLYWRVPAAAALAVVSLGDATGLRSLVIRRDRISCARLSGCAGAL